ncbi:hypothetical protein Emed_003657 [Eimeria media]
MPNWDAPKTQPGAAQSGGRSGVLVYNRGMSPICSDLSDADEAAVDSWGHAARRRFAAPNPPPPPPSSSLRTSEDVYAPPSIGSLRPAYNSEHMHTPTLSVSAPPPAPSPGAFPRKTDPHDGKAPPTPPWRKGFNSTGDSLVSFWVELPHGAPSSLCTTQQQSDTCKPNFSLVPKILPEDPYSSSSLADPYSTDPFSSAHAPAPQPLQQWDVRAAATVKAAMATAAVNNSRFRCNMPLLLPPPMPPACPPLNPDTQGPSRCAPYICRPPPAPAIPPAASSAEMGSWGCPPESQRIRQRQRFRQRRDGLPFASGLPTKLPLPSQCNQIPLQQHHQPPEKPMLAPRRTCYRCRRRGHEASECPAGQSFNNMHAKT